MRPCKHVPNIFRGKHAGLPLRWATILYNSLPCVRHLLLYPISTSFIKEKPHNSLRVQLFVLFLQNKVKVILPIVGALWLNALITNVWAAFSSGF